MKTRIIQTRYWDDQFVNEAHYLTRYLYIYILTSQYINISGIFQLTINKILFETGLDKKQFSIAEKELRDAKKIIFIDGWVFVLNARKNNKYENSPMNSSCYENEVEKVPSGVMDSFKLYQNSSMDTTMDSSIKQEIINNKQEINNKYNNRELVTEVDFEEIAVKYKVPIAFVKSKFEDICNWEDERPGKMRGRNWRLTLMNWVKRDSLKIKMDYAKDTSDLALD